MSSAWSSAMFVYFKSSGRFLTKTALFKPCHSSFNAYSQWTLLNNVIKTQRRFCFNRFPQVRGSCWLWYVHKNQDYYQKKDNKFPYYLMFIPVAVKRFFGYETEEEQDPKATLIYTIKRSILLIQRGEKDKAEQMLHIALKMAQEQQSEEGITYIYDIMANLAFDNDENEKAEKLFVSLLRRCLTGGMQQSDNRFIHINLKLAKVYQYSNSPDKSELGFKFCLDALEKKLPTHMEDEDTVMLWCLALDWYGRFLLEQGKSKEALTYLNKANDNLVKFAGEDHPQAVLLLNDLGIAHSMTDDEATAMDCFEKAIKLGKDLQDPLVPNIMVNVGLLYLRRLMFDQATDWCTQGTQAAKKLEDTVTEKEAQECLTAIKQAMKAGG